MNPICQISTTDRYSTASVMCNAFLWTDSYFIFGNQVNEKFVGAGKAMWATLKCPNVWRPCLYMYLSLALCLDINEGLFYWYTDSKDGPNFSQVDFHH